MSKAGVWGAGSAVMVALVLMEGCAADAPVAGGERGSADRIATNRTVGACTSDEPMTRAIQVCRGEDWWLPDHVQQSTEGRITMYSRSTWDALLSWMLGGGSYTTSTTNPYTRNTTGQTLNFKANVYTYEDGDWSTVDYETILTQLGEADCIQYCEEQQAAEAQAAVGWSGAAYPALRDTYDASVAWSAITCRDTSDRTLCSSDARSAFEVRQLNLMTFQTETATYMGADNLENIGVDDWGTRVGQWCDDNGLSSCMDALSSSSETFLEKHEETGDIWSEDTYEALTALLVNVYDGIVDVDDYGVFGNLQVNGETAVYPYYHDQGIFTSTGLPRQSGDPEPLGSFEELVELHRPFWERTGIPPEHLMVSIGTGGVEVEPWVKVAKDPAGDGSMDPMGLASHGPNMVMNYRHLQHLEHVSYDEDRKAFVATRDHDFAFLHTDLENLDHTPDTFGQYRFFRMAALSALSLRFDSLLVTNTTLPSDGLAQGVSGLCSPDTRCAYFDYAQIAEENADDFLHWMTQTIGRETPVEAWCAPYELGSEGNGDSFLSRRKVNLTTDTLGKKRWTDSSVYRPLQRFFGSHCAISAENPGTAGIPLDEDWVGDALFSSTAGRSHRILTGGNALAYEGRKPSKRGITFEIDEDVLSRSDDVVVRVVFRVEELLVRLDDARLVVAFNGDTRREVKLHELNAVKGGWIYTASIPMPIENPKNTSLTVFGVVRENGVIRKLPLDVSVLMVRVIPWSGGFVLSEELGGTWSTAERSYAGTLLDFFGWPFRFLYGLVFG